MLISITLFFCFT
jgi:serine/threonine-protein kinase ULK4